MILFFEAPNESSEILDPNWVHSQLFDNNTPERNNNLLSAVITNNLKAKGATTTSQVLVFDLKDIMPSSGKYTDSGSKLPDLFSKINDLIRQDYIEQLYINFDIDPERVAEYKNTELEYLYKQLQSKELHIPEESRKHREFLLQKRKQRVDEQKLARKYFEFTALVKELSDRLELKPGSVVLIKQPVDLEIVEENLWILSKTLMCDIVYYKTDRFEGYYNVHTFEYFSDSNEFWNSLTLANHYPKRIRNQKRKIYISLNLAFKKLLTFPELLNFNTIAKVRPFRLAVYSTRRSQEKEEELIKMCQDKDTDPIKQFTAELILAAAGSKYSTGLILDKLKLSLDSHDKAPDLIADKNIRNNLLDLLEIYIDNVDLELDKETNKKIFDLIHSKVTISLADQISILKNPDIMHSVEDLESLENALHSFVVCLIKSGNPEYKEQIEQYIDNFYQKQGYTISKEFRFLYTLYRSKFAKYIDKAKSLYEWKSNNNLPEEWFDNLDLEF